MAYCPVYLGPFSQVTEKLGRDSRVMLIQSCLPSEEDSLYVNTWFAGLFVCLHACFFMSTGFTGDSIVRKDNTAVKYVLR